MKDETIRVGDLVYVAKLCPCGDRSDLGFTFRVNRIQRKRMWSVCCGLIKETEFALPGVRAGWPLSYLKKIHPPEQGVTTKTEEEALV